MMVPGSLLQPLLLAGPTQVGGSLGVHPWMSENDQRREGEVMSVGGQLGSNKKRRKGRVTSGDSQDEMEDPEDQKQPGEI